MNQLMLELYQQALEFAYKNISKESWNTDNFHAVVSGKFGELIVKECMDLVASRPYIDDGNWSHPSMLIKQHFGVER